MYATLIVPAPFSTVSGGYGYDRRMIAGLRDLGHSIDVTAVAGTYPLPDAIAHEAVCAALDSLPPGTQPIIDGLALPACTGLDDALSAVGAIGLIHHPTSLETGLDDATASQLREIEHRLLPRLRQVIVTSVLTRDTLVRDFGVVADRITVVTPGTDAAPRAVGSGSPICRILSIGTLIPRKGHDLLLRALERLFDLNWHLTIVGAAAADPAYAGALRDLAGQLGIAERVTFAGQIVGDALEVLWQSADLFALATHYEGYGMVIAEALKRGLPIVVTQGGAAADLLTPEAGLACPVGDRDQVSKSLRRVIFSAALRREIADKAWELGQTLPNWADQAVLFARALRS